VIHSSGVLLLTALFTLLVFLIQRAEKNRRFATFIILILFAAPIVSGYGIYRITNECTLPFPIMCLGLNFRARQEMIAYATVNTAVVWALVLNFIFWALIGRYNPPGSSDEIKVIGLKD